MTNKGKTEDKDMANEVDTQLLFFNLYPKTLKCSTSLR